MIMIFLYKIIILKFTLEENESFFLLIRSKRKYKYMLAKTSIIILFLLNQYIVHRITKTRTKTSIRYAKENDREKRERRKERERKVKGEI